MFFPSASAITESVLEDAAAGGLRDAVATRGRRALATQDHRGAIGAPGIWGAEYSNDAVRSTRLLVPTRVTSAFARPACRGTRRPWWRRLPHRRKTKKIAHWRLLSSLHQAFYCGCFGFMAMVDHLTVERTTAFWLRVEAV